MSKDSNSSCTSRAFCKTPPISQYCLPLKEKWVKERKSRKKKERYYSEIQSRGFFRETSFELDLWCNEEVLFEVQWWGDCQILLQNLQGSSELPMHLDLYCPLSEKRESFVSLKRSFVELLTMKYGSLVEFWNWRGRFNLTYFDWSLSSIITARQFWSRWLQCLERSSTFVLESLRFTLVTRIVAICFACSKETPSWYTRYLAPSKTPWIRPTFNCSKTLTSTL